MWKPWVLPILIGLIFTPCKTEHHLCNNGPTTCDPYYPYRSINGSCNNIEHPEWAMSITPYGRLLANNYADGIYAMPVSLTGEPLPLARYVSNKLNPPASKPDKRYTLGLMQFGQIVAHDHSFTGFGANIGSPPVQCCAGGQLGADVDNKRCEPILIPDDDPIFVDEGTKCFSFERTATTFDAGCTSADETADPLTVVTGFIDISIAYGPTDDVARSIRTLSKGRLRVEKRNGQSWPPQVADATTVCGGTNPDRPCYDGGDVRMNQNPQLTILQTTFVREHNRLADILASLNPHWDDEKIYQEARRINIAMYQHIVYTEYVPRLVGQSFSEDTGLVYPGVSQCINDYNPNVDPTVVVEYASAALRALHSQISGSLDLVNEHRETIGSLRLSSNIGTPNILEVSNSTYQCDLNYDHLTRGLGYQPPEHNDKYFHEEIKHYLFRGGGKYGVDLRAIDIQRERDHGVGTYVRAREYCNLPVPTSFDDLKDYIPAEDVEAIKLVYNDVRDISLNSGGLLEYHAPDALVGPTFQCIIAKQFYKSRVGDRFFYENCAASAFTTEQLHQIRNSGSFACLLCRNAYCVDKMQPQAFDPVRVYNPLVKCSELCALDLTSWREESYEASPQSQPVRIGASLNLF